MQLQFNQNYSAQQCHRNLIAAHNNCIFHVRAARCPTIVALVSIEEYPSDRQNRVKPEKWRGTDVQTIEFQHDESFVC